VVVDGGFQGFAALRISGFFAGFQVFPSYLRVVKLFGQVALSVQGILPQRFQYPLPDFFQRLSGLDLLGQRFPLQFCLNFFRQALIDEPLDDPPLVVHDAVDAEVQVGQVELEEIA